MNDLYVYLTTVLGGGLIAAVYIQRDAARSEARHAALTQPHPMTKVFVRFAATFADLQRAMRDVGRKWAEFNKDVHF